MKGKKRYRKRKGYKKEKGIINNMWVTQEIRKQLNRLRDAVGKISFGREFSSFEALEFTPLI